MSARNGRRPIRATPRKELLLLLPLAALPSSVLLAQPAEVNYDEAKVPTYTLPDPLVMADGRKVTDAEMWRRERRPELLRLFETHVYGRSPEKPAAMKSEVTSLERGALGGKATRKEVSLRLTPAADGPALELLIYVPAGATRPVRRQPPSPGRPPSLVRDRCCGGMRNSRPWPPAWPWGCSRRSAWSRTCSRC